MVAVASGSKDLGVSGTFHPSNNKILQDAEICRLSIYTDIQFTAIVIVVMTHFYWEILCMSLNKNSKDRKQQSL